MTTDMTAIIELPAPSGLTASGLSGGVTQERWRATKLHCPGCGQQAVWHDTGGGDYYVGEQHICIACRSYFYLPQDVTPIEQGSIDWDRAVALAKQPTPT